MFDAIMGFLGNERTNAANAKMAKQQMDFQERMSNTAHQREVADLRAAGLNPILSAKFGGSSTPAGAMATQTNSIASALNAKLLNAQIDKTKQETANLKNTQSITSPAAKIGDLASSAVDLLSNVSSPWDSLQFKAKTIQDWANRKLSQKSSAKFEPSMPPWLERLTIK